MSDYKRLTMREFAGVTGDIIYNRLAELENKIERGEIDYVSDRGKEIARLTAENQRLREEAAEQKSIAEHEHATQMEWFRLACDYKAENAEIRHRAEAAEYRAEVYEQALYHTAISDTEYQEAIEQAQKELAEGKKK